MKELGTVHSCVTVQSYLGKDTSTTLVTCMTCNANTERLLFAIGSSACKENNNTHVSEKKVVEIRKKDFHPLLEKESSNAFRESPAKCGAI